MMKKLLTILLIFFFFKATATNWYFSASGNDGNVGSLASPWLTISKFNNVFSSKLPGDSFLFNRGDVFFGKMIIARSGNSSLPIVVGAYGSGADPVITGFYTVPAWTNLGSNIWESTSAVSTLSYTNMVTVSGVNTAMGRSPNTGFYTYQSHSGNPATSLTSSNLNAATINWTGAEAAFFITTYIVGRNPITAHSAQTITITPSPSEVGLQSDNQGFIIQNDVRTLDVQNEWYYNPSTKKLRIYSTSSPTSVQVSTIDTLVYNNGFDYITFDNITLSGSNKITAQVQNSATNNIFQNCDILFAGRDGIFVPNSGTNSNLKVENCTFNNIHNNAVNAWYTATAPSAIFRSNTVKNIGLLFGMGGGFLFTGVGGTFHTGVILNGSNTLIELNRIDSIGYNGTQVFGTGSTVQYNYITNFCRVATDGGGIYTVNSGVSPIAQTGLRILYNIVRFSTDMGIYTDDAANGIEIGYNTVTDCSGSGGGIYAHNNFNCNWHHNTSYDNAYAQFNNRPSSPSITHSGNSLRNNIFFSRTSSQRTAFFYKLETLSTAFSADSNYYARPIDDNLTIDAYYNGVYGLKTLAQYKVIVTPDEVASQKSPITISDVNDLRFEYNATSSAVVTALPYKYIDVRGVVYDGTITLQPYTSAVLIKNGATSNILPVADAGIDQSIAISTVTLSGGGTDADGTIASYLWTKISGPSVGTIASPTSASTTCNGLLQGVHLFSLRVTDNVGGIDLDTIQVTVTLNLVPLSNAGADRTINTSSVSITGVGTDTDGTITTYAWTNISGPNTPTITTPSTASTSVTGLIVGTYVLRLTVTDNNSATASDDVSVVVQASNTIIRNFIIHRHTIYK